MRQLRIIPFKEISAYGYRHCHRTGESIVFFSPDKMRVYKYKNPFAKAPMKHVPSADVSREYLVHNAIFPETPYTLEGIDHENGELRQIFSQRFIPSVKRPSCEQIKKALLERGLHPEGKYAYSNEFVTVLDVEGDNTLIGEDGLLYFIDPIIGFKAPIDDILEHYSEVGIIKQTPISENISFIVKFKSIFRKNSSLELHGKTMDDGTGIPAMEWLEKQPEKWRYVIGKALWQCIQRSIPLHEMNIQYVARENPHDD